MRCKDQPTYIFTLLLSSNPNPSPQCQMEWFISPTIHKLSQGNSQEKNDKGGRERCGLDKEPKEELRIYTQIKSTNKQGVMDHQQQQPSARTPIKPEKVVDCPGNFLIWRSSSSTEDPPNKKFKPISIEDISSNLPPILFKALADLYYAHLVFKALATLFDIHHLDTPKNIQDLLHRSKSNLDSSWNKLKQKFIDSNERFYKHTKTNDPESLKLISFQVPFMDIKEAQSKSEKIQELAFVEAQRRFSLPKYRPTHGSACIFSEPPAASSSPVTHQDQQLIREAESVKLAQERSSIESIRLDQQSDNVQQSRLESSTIDVTEPIENETESSKPMPSIPIEQGVEQDIPVFPITIPSSSNLDSGPAQSDSSQLPSSSTSISRMPSGDLQNGLVPAQSSVPQSQLTHDDQVQPDPQTTRNQLDSIPSTNDPLSHNRVPLAFSPQQLQQLHHQQQQAQLQLQQQQYQQQVELQRQQQKLQTQIQRQKLHLYTLQQQKQNQEQQEMKDRYQIQQQCGSESMLMGEPSRRSSLADTAISNGTMTTRPSSSHTNAPLTELQLQAKHSSELALFEQQYFRGIQAIEADFNQYMNHQTDINQRNLALQSREFQLNSGKQRYHQFMVNTVNRHRLEVHHNRLRLSQFIETNSSLTHNNNHHHHYLQSSGSSVHQQDQMNASQNTPTQQPISVGCTNTNEEEEEIEVLSTPNDCGLKRARSRTENPLSQHQHPSSSSSLIRLDQQQQPHKHSTPPHKRARTEELTKLLEVGRTLHIDWNSNNDLSPSTPSSTIAPPPSITPLPSPGQREPSVHVTPHNQPSNPTSNESVNENDNNGKGIDNEDLDLRNCLDSSSRSSSSTLKSTTSTIPSPRIVSSSTLDNPQSESGSNKRAEEERDHQSELSTINPSPPKDQISSLDHQSIKLAPNSETILLPKTPPPLSTPTIPNNLPPSASASASDLTSPIIINNNNNVDTDNYLDHFFCLDLPTKPSSSSNSLIHTSSTSIDDTLNPDHDWLVFNF
ncbi:hypothetical protein PSTG_05768 [Puccinia striiformis f. sp. tritici PST-78]|uniref:Uncharacterized protein n=1 Tax=Puccinia striiformis f. sp. tritici PST-78 TaxID=1165861 RepID=A0A0L0VNP3_9BASI|nr:hypothetical protein PSTG_05768 [Puccinia striiformis f. sp. tritici PST-78]